jgi:hypothetical protein
MTILAAVADFSGRRKNRPLASIEFIACGKIYQQCYDTGEQFIAGVNDTGDNIFSPVLLIQVRNNQKA